jgi:hypothetical protein
MRKSRQYYVADLLIAVLDMQHEVDIRLPGGPRTHLLVRELLPTQDRDTFCFLKHVSKGKFQEP